MLFWLGLVAGAIIGWVVEWVIDWRFWRSDLSVTSDEETQLRQELDVARLEIRNLQSQLQQQSPTSPASEHSHRDRLQDINGVGNIYAQKLNAADIYTFAHLSELSVEQLTEIINPQEWQTLDFAEWIRQARAYTQSADRGE